MDGGLWTSTVHLQFGEMAETLRQVRQAIARQVQFPQCLQLTETAGKFCQTWAVLEFHNQNKDG